MKLIQHGDQWFFGDMRDICPDCGARADHVAILTGHYKIEGIKGNQHTCLFQCMNCSCQFEITKEEDYDN